MKGNKKLSRRHRVIVAGGDVFGSSAPHRAWGRYLLPMFVFCWPFLYLFRHVVPINGAYTAIGNDFILLYYKYKVYLLANLVKFRFPLWSPSEAAGFPFYTNPFAQAFYPFNLLLVGWYKIFGGYSPLDHQIFTVLGISIFALGLFMWLKLLNKNIRAVLFAVLVMSVSFKVTEIIRFPNAVHTAAWYPWILYAMTKIILSRSSKKTAQYGLLLIFFLICLCTGGYPYYAYYGLFLFVPYLIVFFIKPLRTRLIDTEAINWKRALLTLTLAGIAAALICGPYILGIKQLMSETIDRAGKDFGYSTEHIFSFEDTIGSLVYPPAASTEGWYFFSITALLLIVMYLFSRRGKSELASLGSGAQADIVIKLFFLIWIAMVSYISYGRSSYLFILLWKFLPGFASLRVWGRLNIILVPIFAWLLSLAYVWFEEVIWVPAKRGPSGRDTSAIGKRTWVFSPITALIGAYAVILGVQLYLLLYNVRDEMWDIYFRSLSPNRIWFIVYGAVAAATLFLLVILGRKIKHYSHWYLRGAVAIVILIAVLEMRHTAVHIWTYQRKWENERFNLDIAQINEASFRFGRTDYASSISLSANFSVGTLVNWYLTRYIQFLKSTESEPDARRILLGVRGGNKIFFSESIQHPTIKSFLADAARYSAATGRLVSYNGDELNWEIEAPVAGYLSFIDNWDWGWKASVDGSPVKIELLFGTFKSVRLSPGQHRVRFYYQPTLFFGQKDGL